MVEPGKEGLPIGRQCELLGLSRSGYYYRPHPVSVEDMELMRLIDEEYTRHPFRGSRRMVDWLADQGHPVGRDRVRRLMRVLGLQAIYPKKRLSLENKAHPKYPYLLGGLSIDRPNQVWCSDITYIRLRGGFVYLVDGLAQSVRAELGAFQHAGHGVLREGVGASDGCLASGDLQHRPGEPIHERGVHVSSEGGRRADQHGRPRPGVRQHHDRAIVAKREVRGGLPEGLPERVRLPAIAGVVLRVLQPRASAPGPRPADAVVGVQSGRVGGSEPAAGWGVAPLRSLRSLRSATPQPKAQNPP